MVTQIEIAAKLGLDVSSVNKILNRCKGPVFKKETIRSVFRTARDLGYDFGRLKYRHRRRHNRRTVKMNAQVFIYNKDGTLYDQGNARIEDLSVGGARISEVALPLGCLPLEPFTIRIRLLRKPLDTVEISGRVVRMLTKDNVALGVAFDNVDTDIRRRLEQNITN